MGSVEGGSILLVDDDPDILEFLAVYLESSGHTVSLASSGEHALDEVESDPPELIISDVRMPGMSGYELCKRLRSAGHDEVPFIFCSFLGSLPERIRGLRTGADDYVVKPVDPAELLLKVETSLARSRRLKRLEEEVSARSSPVLLEGRIGELTVSDVLQIASQARWRQVRIVLELERGRRGSLHLQGDRLLHAEVAGLEGTPAFHRLLHLASGHFRIESRPFRGEPTVDEKVEACVLEGAVFHDQYRHLQARLEPHGEGLRVRSGAQAASPPLDGKSAHVLDLVARAGSLDRVVEESDLAGLETLRIVGDLLDRGSIEPAPGARTSVGGDHGREARRP